ncbi:MAG TPA: 3D domain-containing protein [bacterium]|nr:3D domain-containing protein [bacterium]
MRKWAVGLLLLVSTCFLPRAQTTSGVVRTGVQPPDFLLSGRQDSVGTPQARYLGRFKITYYWAVDEAEYPTSRSSAIYLADGQLLGRFSSAFVKAFREEAAACLKDGRRISYLKQANRAQVVDEYLGCSGHRLTELRSIAVDPRIIPLGSIVYIPQAENVSIDGQVLGGVFYAHDVGTAVRGKHIDIFVGRKQNMDAFTSAGMGSSSGVDVYILE